MVNLADIVVAQERIRPVAVRTGLVEHGISGSGQERLYLKPENHQPIGAFKLRGAYNKIASLSHAQREAGVITYSSGNHAQGVAFAARALGIHAVIVMPDNAPPIKLQKTLELGAEVVLVGSGSEERRIKAEDLARLNGYVMVPPYNDELIIAGQGTIGLEILEDLPGVETVFAPVGGGGLLSGVATAIQLNTEHMGRTTKVRVIGVEPALAADAQASFRSGRLVTIPGEQTGRTIADGLRTQSLGDITLAHILKYVDDIITVSEDEIRETVRRLAAHPDMVVEPSGAVAAAGYIFHRNELPQSTMNVAILSGGNIDAAVLAEILG